MPSGPQIDPDMPDVVALAGAAEILDVSVGHAHRLQQAGKLKGRKAKGATYWVFREQHVRELKAERDGAV